MSDNTKAEIRTLPEGRLINESLFKKDQYNEKATPSYKVEVAFDWEHEEQIVDWMLEAAVAKWGEGIADSDELHLPILDGDKLKAKREKKGKSGDAYEDKMVIRANTIYNADGVDGDGGIQVYDENKDAVEAVNRKEIYSGSHGRMAVTFGTYEGEDRDGNTFPAITAYLVAWQKTGDGEKLVQSADRSTLFEKVGKVSDDAPRSRRTRRG